MADLAAADSSSAHLISEQGSQAWSRLELVIVVAAVELLLFYAKTRRRMAVSDQCDATTYKKEIVSPTLVGSHSHALHMAVWERSKWDQVVDSNIRSEEFSRIQLLQIPPKPRGI